MKSILLVEDDITFSEMLKRFLERNYRVASSYNIANARQQLSTSKFDLVFTDLRLPDGDGITLLNDIRAKYPETPVVLMTGYAEVSTAVKAMKHGAFDYISKPFNPDEVLEVIKNALEVIPENPAPVKKESETPAEFVTGISAASKTLNEYINLVAPTDLSVLITGASGTGKEVVAKSIHLKSHRSNAPFIAVDCGSIPNEIASSEFFGHKKGSFTGAVNDKIGHFEAANNGTLFLDEIGNLSYENQVQLLRALQERRVKPVGSSKEVEVDIRLITATNDDLLKAVENGTFREDLYHRLNEFSIKVPDLKDRIDDIVLYADYFLNNVNKQLNKSIIGFSADVLNVFQKYSWSGNLRELSNVIKRAALLTKGNIIEKNVLPEAVLNNHTNPSPATFSTKANEKELIISALKEAGNNKTLAAKLLNITRKTLYNKMKEYGLN